MTSSLNQFQTLPATLHPLHARYALGSADRTALDVVFERFDQMVHRIHSEAKGGGFLTGLMALKANGDAKLLVIAEERVLTELKSRVGDEMDGVAIHAEIGGPIRFCDSEGTDEEGEDFSPQMRRYGKLPFSCGISSGVVDGEEETATLGGFVKIAGATETYLLTAGHAMVPGRNVRQPPEITKWNNLMDMKAMNYEQTEPIRQKYESQSTVWEISRPVRADHRFICRAENSHIDYALAELDPSKRPPAEPINARLYQEVGRHTKGILPLTPKPEPMPATQYHNSTRVLKYGATTGLTEGILMNEDMGVVRVLFSGEDRDLPSLPMMTILTPKPLDRQHVFSVFDGFSSLGDSGAAVLEYQTNKVVGFVMGGDMRDGARLTFVCSYHSIKRHFQSVFGKELEWC